MNKVSRLFRAALVFAGLFHSIDSTAYMFTPASPSDTDSGYLVDNYSVLINGSQVNSNFNFESGDFSGFNHLLATRVIDSLGSVAPTDRSKYFAFASTGPGSAPGGVFEHQNIMQPFSLSSPVNQAIVSLDVIILTNENPTTTSDPDWFHYLIWYGSGGTLVFPPHNLFYGEIPAFTFHAAPSDTGFLWMTDLLRPQYDITSFINDAVSEGSHDFQVHAVIAEAYRAASVPEPATLALLGLGLAGLGFSRRKQ